MAGKELSQKALLKAYRKAFKRALVYLRREHRRAHQQTLGWVMTRVSKAITENPTMGRKALCRLIDSLVIKAPDVQ